MNEYSVFAQRLKEVRQKRNMTQKDLADKIAVSATTVSAYENVDEYKRKKPTLDNLVAMAKALEVSIDWLSGLSDNEENNNSMSNEQQDVIPLSEILQHMLELNCLDSDIGVQTGKFSELGDRRDLHNYQLAAQDEDGEKLYNFLNIQIYNKEVVNFMNSYMKLSYLYTTKNISKETRDVWYNASLNQVSKIMISLDEIDTIGLKQKPGDIDDGNNSKTR